MAGIATGPQHSQIMHWLLPVKNYNLFFLLKEDEQICLWYTNEKYTSVFIGTEMFAFDRLYTNKKYHTIVTCSSKGCTAKSYARTGTVSIG